MTRRTVLQSLPVLLALTSRAPAGYEKYSGPRPGDKDVPFLLHGDTLLRTEVQEATASDHGKKGQVFSVPNATSTARTPLAEPIFLFLSDRIRPDQLGLFKFEVRDGKREISLGGKHKSSDDDQEFHLSLRQLDGALYRIESSQMLEPGEYSLSPQGQNTAFCFTVF